MEPHETSGNRTYRQSGSVSKGKVSLGRLRERWHTSGLVEAGYTNVRRYSGGLSDWAAAGYELNGESAAGASGGAFFFPSQPPTEG